MAEKLYEFSRKTARKTAGKTESWNCKKVVKNWNRERLSETVERKILNSTVYYLFLDSKKSQRENFNFQGREKGSSTVLWTLKLFLQFSRIKALLFQKKSHFREEHLFKSLPYFQERYFQKKMDI
mgnify:CR=1 FL=1